MGARRSIPHRHEDGRCPPSSAAGRSAATLRIIGGRLRGRKIRYGGGSQTRPMKDRVREAVFNLVGAGAVGTHALDLFAGTGALGIEALSRGAERATFFERHFPTAQILRENIESCGLAAVSEVFAADTFSWFAAHSLRTDLPLLVLCSPPFQLYVERPADVRRLLEMLLEEARPGSVAVVEADERFDLAQLPRPQKWDVRRYPPSVVAVRHVE